MPRYIAKYIMTKSCMEDTRAKWSNISLKISINPVMPGLKYQLRILSGFRIHQKVYCWLANSLCTSVSLCVSTTHSKRYVWVTDSLYHPFKIYLLLHVVSCAVWHSQKRRACFRCRNLGKNLVGEAAGSGSKSCGPGRGRLTTATAAALFLYSWIAFKILSLSCRVKEIEVKNRYSKYFRNPNRWPINQISILCNA